MLSGQTQKVYVDEKCLDPNDIRDVTRLLKGQGPGITVDNSKTLSGLMFLEINRGHLQPGGRRTVPFLVLGQDPKEEGYIVATHLMMSGKHINKPFHGVALCDTRGGFANIAWCSSLQFQRGLTKNQNWSRSYTAVLKTRKAFCKQLLELLNSHLPFLQRDWKAVQEVIDNHRIMFRPLPDNHNENPPDPTMFPRYEDDIAGNYGNDGAENHDTDGLMLGNSDSHNNMVEQDHRLMVSNVSRDHNHDDGDHDSDLDNHGDVYQGLGGLDMQISDLDNDILEEDEESLDHDFLLNNEDDEKDILAAQSDNRADDDDPAGLWNAYHASLQEFKSSEDNMRARSHRSRDFPHNANAAANRWNLNSGDKDEDVEMKLELPSLRSNPIRAKSERLSLEPDLTAFTQYAQNRLGNQMDTIEIDDDSDIEFGPVVYRGSRDAPVDLTNDLDNGNDMMVIELD